jgi:hypothetical protein
MFFVAAGELTSHETYEQMLHDIIKIEFPMSIATALLS